VSVLTGFGLRFKICRVPSWGALGVSGVSCQAASGR